MTNSITPARVLVLLTIAVTLILVLASAVLADGPGEPVAHTTHRVVSGDNLWDIAAERTPPGADVRRTIHQIRDLNGLSGSLILPGQVLVVPSAG